MPQASPWWTPHIHADRRPFLLQRARILSGLRGFFSCQDFLEVDTAILQISPGNEAHIAGFATSLQQPDGAREQLYLHSSPEFACKKLLAAGESRIFTFAHVFRNGERGAMHHPEFTMLEWYRASEPYTRLMQDCAQLLAAAAEAVKARIFQFKGIAMDPFAAPEILSVVEAFARYATIDLAATLKADGPDRDALASQARAIDMRVTEDDTWSDIFSKIISARIEPRLGHGRATILTDYPACEAALARVKTDDPRFAERFELYGCGVELANAFGELTDATEQRRRFEAEMTERQRIYNETYPLDEDFLSALAIMPQASGIALGLDRLVMLATGATRIEQVIWTPVAAHGAPL